MQFRLLSFFLLAIRVAVLGGLGGSALAAESGKSGASAAPVQHRNAGPIAPMTAPNYRAIVDRYGSAVVGITVEDDRRSTPTGAQNPLDDDAVTPSIPSGRSPDSRQPVVGIGSGFIIDSNGLVLTNAHVIRGASSVKVTLNDRREFKATVLGFDSSTDVAVLKIDAKDLPTVTLGDSEQVKVGDYVLAIGTPFGFDATATSGIVSALHRLLPNEPLVPFIQTDAAVNPGNSGGPLFNSSGEVVGMNAQIYSRTGGFEGLSFATPIDLAKRIADQIISEGKVRHASLGVTVQPMTQSLAESFDMARPDGALISTVTPHSAASRAGLQAGDVILKYNNVTIHQAADVSVMLGIAKPDDNALFVIWRNDAQVEINATLSQIPSEGGDDGAETTIENRMGVIVKPLSSDERKVANVSRGLLVINASGPAEKAGIQPGDLLLSVNGAPIEDAQQLRFIIGIGKPTVALLVQRGDTRTYIPIVME